MLNLHGSLIGQKGQETDKEEGGLWLWNRDCGLEADSNFIARHTATLETQSRGTADDHPGDQEALDGVLGVLVRYFWSIHMPASYKPLPLKSENILCSTTKT